MISGSGPWWGSWWGGGPGRHVDLGVAVRRGPPGGGAVGREQRLGDRLLTRWADDADPAAAEAELRAAG